MPTASGAAGRADRGADPGTTWPLDALRTKTKAAGRNCDSYLQRYEELQNRKKKKIKINSLQVIRDQTEPEDEESEGEDEGAREESPQEDASGEDHTSGEPLSGARSKRSRLCVLL